MSLGRKIDRVKEVLNGLAKDLKDFRLEASESYVKTEEFQELLERWQMKGTKRRETCTGRS